MHHTSHLLLPSNCTNWTLDRDNLIAYYRDLLLHVIELSTCNITDWSLLLLLLLLFWKPIPFGKETWPLTRRCYLHDCSNAHWCTMYIYIYIYIQFVYSKDTVFNGLVNMMVSLVRLELNLFHSEQVTTTIVQIDLVTMWHLFHPLWIEDTEWIGWYHLNEVGRLFSQPAKQLTNIWLNQSIKFAVFFVFLLVVSARSQHFSAHHHPSLLWKTHSFT